MKLKELLYEVSSITSEGKMDATDSTLFMKIVVDAWNRLEGRKNSLWVDKKVVDRTLSDWRQVSEILERIVERCDENGSYVSPEELKQLGRFYEGLRHTLTDFYRYSQTLRRNESDAGEEKEGRRPMVRTPSILIGELERDFDEIELGKAQKEDWRIELGLGDARRDLKELWRAITEASG